MMVHAAGALIQKCSTATGLSVLATPSPAPVAKGLPKPIDPLQWSNPFTSPGGDSYSITVRMSGVVGDESVSLEVGDQTIETWTVATGMLDYTVTTDVTGEIRVAFTNDAGDRDVQVDYIIANGITYPAEDQRANTGFHDGTSCGSGGYSEMLHCNGYISFGNPFDDEPSEHCALPSQFNWTSSPALIGPSQSNWASV